MANCETLGDFCWVGIWYSVDQEVKMEFCHGDEAQRNVNRRVCLTFSVSSALIFSLCIETPAHHYWSQLLLCRLETCLKIRCQYSTLPPDLCWDVFQTPTNNNRNSWNSAYKSQKRLQRMYDGSSVISYIVCTLISASLSVSPSLQVVSLQVVLGSDASVMRSYDVTRVHSRAAWQSVWLNPDRCVQERNWLQCILLI